MPFYLSYEIDINGVLYKGVNSVNIERSIYNLVQTATIKLPASGIIKNDQGQTNVQIIDRVARGDEVSLSLGYDDNNDIEFIGYVDRVIHGNPATIECVDQMYLLRETTIQKTYTETPLIDILSDLLSGTGLSVNNNTQDITVKKLIAATQTGEEVSADKVLNKIKETLGISIYFTRAGELYAGLDHAFQLGEVNYSLGKNTRDEGKDLEFHSADEMKLEITAFNFADDGTKTSVKVGDNDGAKRTIFYYNVESESKLKELATNDLEKYKYNGYQGTFECFGLPFSEPGMVANITDPLYSERSGKYAVDSVIIDFGQQGFIRKNEISIKL